MFIGHFGLGFAAKRATPRVSLALLFAAAQLADLLWPVLLALGIEQVRIDPGHTAVTPLDFVSYPYSHSLAMLVVWGVLLGGLYRLMNGRQNGRAAGLLALLVVSHWPLDWLMHGPDLPLYPGGPKVGLDLWRSLPVTVLVELPLFAIGVWIYAASTRAKDGRGRWAFVSLVGVLLLLYVADLFGGPPPSVTALWISALAGAIAILAWTSWADRHRTPA